MFTGKKDTKHLLNLSRTTTILLPNLALRAGFLRSVVGKPSKSEREGLSNVGT